MTTGRPAINLRVAVSASQLRELYVAQGLTIEQVASGLGLGATTIGRRLRELGIPARRRGSTPAELASREPIWAADLAYIVGLIATDGNLSKKPGRIAIMSNDADLLDLIRRRLLIDAPVKRHQGGYGVRCHHLIWSDRRFYDWLAAIGLTPAKSLTLGPLVVPNAYFADFLRGCIDGDGSIVSYVDRYNTFKNPRYVYTRLYVSLASASFRFIQWVRQSVQGLVGVLGQIDVRRTTGRHDIWRLRYAKRESLAVLRWMYYEREVLCLDRKRRIAEPFLVTGPVSAGRGPGRPVIV